MWETWQAIHACEDHTKKYCYSNRQRNFEALQGKSNQKYKVMLKVRVLDCRNRLLIGRTFDNPGNNVKSERLCLRTVIQKDDAYSGKIERPFSQQKEMHGRFLRHQNVPVYPVMPDELLS